MNYQETYNTVKAHLLNQGTRAVRSADSDRCAYRNSEGLKCAVGCLILDELYDPYIEGFSPYRFNEELCEAMGIKCNADREFLKCLQSIHDTREPGTWLNALEIFAKNVGLTP